MAVDCVVHCDRIIKTLEAQAASRDKRLERFTKKLAKKDEQLQLLEEQIVQMSLDLVKAQAAADISKSTRRTSDPIIDDNDNDNSVEDLDESYKSLPAQPPSSQQQQQCVNRHNSLDMSACSRATDYTTDLDESNQSLDESSRGTGLFGLFRKSSRVQDHEVEVEQDDIDAYQADQEAFFKQAQEKPDSMVVEDESKKECVEENDSDNHKDKGNNTVTLLDTSSSSRLDESTSTTRRTGLFGIFRRSSMMNDNGNMTHQAQAESQGRAAAAEVAPLNDSNYDDEQQQTRRATSKFRQQRQLKASSRSFLQGVVFPISHEDVESKYM